MYECMPQVCVFVRPEVSDLLELGLQVVVSLWRGYWDRTEVPWKINKYS